MRDVPPDFPTQADDSLALEAEALRYVAGELPTNAVEAFEARLATDQAARDAVAEAVRLSAAALGQDAPTPDRSFRAVIRERLFRPRLPGWLARRAYHGHPFVWAGVGASVVALAAVVAVQLVAPPSVTTPATPTALPAANAPAPVPGPSSVPVVGTNPAPFDGAAVVNGSDAGTDSKAREAELWAHLSTPDHVEKAVGDDARWKQRLRDLQHAGSGRTTGPVIR